MSNIKVTTMTVEEVQAATAALKLLRETNLTFVLPLSAAERAVAPKLGGKAVQTTQMRLAMAREHRVSLPESFDLRRFERETALLVALGECVAMASQIESDVHDTFRVIGRGATQTSRLVYGHLQVVAHAEDGLKRSVQHMKARGRRSKGAAPAATTTAAPATPATAPAAPLVDANVSPPGNPPDGPPAKKAA